MIGSPLPSWYRIHAGVVLILFNMGCDSPAIPPPFPLHIHVSTENGTPVTGATIAVNGLGAGATNKHGELALRFSAIEGNALSVNVSCPPGFESPNDTASLAVRRLTTLDGSGTFAALRHRLTCNPTEQTSVVVVSTNEPNLPVLVNGIQQGLTNIAGFAHVSLRGKPNTTFEVELDTRANLKLRPQVPARSFTLGRSNELFRFEQQLRTQNSAVRRIPKTPEPRVPYRID
jgi:hypothetical protein